MFEVLLSPPAGRYFDNADPPLRKRLERCFQQLRLDPYRHNNIKRLTGEFVGLLRFRVGDWRVIYRVDDSASRVVVIDIGHRRDVYE
ncbi:MAG: type II toxin-antitoxin system RelE/ParE family toxin [Tepidisphaeraceae bacterium]